MQCVAHKPFYEIDPQTGASIEIFYADRSLERRSGEAALVGSGGIADAA